MAKIELKQFGGILPSVDKRRLPMGAAQTAHNLDLRFGDFRPLEGPGGSVATVDSNTQSIFRTPSGTWLSSTNDVDYVNAQVNDAAFERVYLTGRSAYPESWQGGTYRKLGVPAPTAAPTVSVVLSPEFSTDEFNQSKAALPKQIADMVKARTSQVNLGNAPTNTPPVYATGGWLAHGSQPDLPTNSNLQWAFCVPMVLSGTDYVMVHPENDNHLLAAEFGGKQISYGGNPYWAVPVYWQGQGASVDTVNLTADFKTVMSPADPLVRLWTDAKVDELVAAVAEDYNLTIAPNKGFIDAINSAQLLVDHAYAGQVASLAIKAAVADFFLRTEVVAQITELVGTSTGSSALTNNAAAGAFTARVAGYCYGLGTTTPTGTETVADDRYFHVSDDGPTATNIRADLNSFISTDARGVKVLDAVGLARKVRDEMNVINNKHAIGSRWPSSNIDANVADCVAIATGVYSDTNWAKNPAWPLASSSWRTPATIAARDALRYACDALTQQFITIQQTILSYINTNLFDEYVKTVLPTVVARIVETRAYIVTYVTDRGEESAPSDPSDLLEMDQNDSVDLVIPAAPGGRDITHFRLYRSSSSNVSGQAAFQYVPCSTDPDGWPIATLTINDAHLQEELQESCPSITWAEPRADMIALVGMPNGVMAGLANGGRTICFCEPFEPHAWPREYEKSLAHAGVGLGVFGQTLVVPTEGNPRYISGADSASMSEQIIESPQSCVSKRSIVSADGGVFYASPDGICLAGPTGVSVVSAGAFSGDDWRALGLANSFAAFSEGVYYIWTGT